jgi:hypothetical protein
MDKKERFEFITGFLKLVNSSDWKMYMLPWLKEQKQADLAALLDGENTKSRGRLQFAADMETLDVYLEREKDKLEMQIDNR